jgi:hypothetical protein
MLMLPESKAEPLFFSSDDADKCCSLFYTLPKKFFGRLVQEQGISVERVL